jgi:hypothetical protein
MSWVEDTMIENAGRFLWTSGRVLEQRRFAFLFGEETKPKGVLAALEGYRSPDGGYAFGLDPDVRGPEGQPISMPIALQIMAEIGALDGVQALQACTWLAKHTTADGGVPSVLPSLRPYPRPPWLPVHDHPCGELITTGPITGLLLGTGIEHPWLKSATEFCRRAVEDLEQPHPYQTHAAVAFLDRAPDRAWAEVQAKRLGALVREQRSVLLDPGHPEESRLAPGYAPGEYHLPHDYAPRPDTLARAWFTDAEMERSLRHLAASQQEDGGWPIHWERWCPTTAAEGRPWATLAALLTLRAYDRAQA